MSIRIPSGRTMLATAFRLREGGEKIGLWQELGRERRARGDIEVGMLVVLFPTSLRVAFAENDNDVKSLPMGGHSILCRRLLSTTSTQSKG